MFPPCTLSRAKEIWWFLVLQLGGCLFKSFDRHAFNVGKQNVQWIFLSKKVLTEMQSSQSIYLYTRNQAYILYLYIILYKASCFLTDYLFIFTVEKKKRI